MASREPRKCKAQALDQTVTLERLDAIDRAAWVEATPRTNQWAQSESVNQDQALHEPSRCLPDMACNGVKCLPNHDADRANRMDSRPSRRSMSARMWRLSWPSVNRRLKTLMP